MRFYVDDPLNADWPKRTPDTYASLGMSLVASACEAHGEFACTSRSCAPPPVGTGGSMPSGSRKFSPRNGANPEPYAQRLIAESTDYADSEYIQETESEWRRRMPKNPVVRVRVPLEALEGIARSGRLKTQHETGESQGTYHPELRDENERRMFGDGLKGRPIYGYVAKAGSTTTFSEILTKGKYWYGWEKSGLGQYGDVMIELKPDVHSRVTVTMGDSFETDAAAIPLVDVWNVTPRRRQVSMSWNSERYIEAQIHQRVLVERDIARIYVSNNSKYLDDNPLALRLRQMFPDIEVVELPWEVAAEFSACNEHGEFACTSRACAPPPVGTGGSLRSGRRPLPNGADPEPYAQQRIKEIKEMLPNGWVDAKFNSERAWETLPKNPIVRMRIPLNALDLVVNVSEGKFLSQHETGTSMGLFSPEKRDRVEHRMFSAWDTRPKYGYIAESGERVKSRGMHYYGDIAIEFKDNVTKRTTFTVGDSLVDEIAPMRVEDMWTSSEERRVVTAPFGVQSYVEAQIHGPLTMNDVARIYVERRDFYTYDYGRGMLTDEPNSVFKKILSDYPDIEIVFEVRDVQLQFNVCDLHEEFACTSRSCAPPPVGTGGSLPSGVGDLARAALAGGRDGMVARMYAARGFDAKPTVVSAAQLSHLVRQGKVREAWRGISTAGGESSVPESVARAYIDDRRHPVVGGFAGSGTYVAFGKGGERESRDYAGRGGAVLRIGIPPKMGSEPDLREIAEVVHRLTRKGEGVSLFDRRNIAKGAKVYKSLRDAGIDDEGIRELASDAAVIGMLMGWDGAYVSTGDGGVGYAVVWNRGATYVADEVLTASVTVGFIDGALVAACDLHGEFACTSRACAPPPVGTGGSLPSGGGISTSERGRSPLPKGATSEEAGKFASSQPHGQGGVERMVAGRLGGTPDTIDVTDGETRVRAKIQSNERIIEKATRNPQFQKGLKRLLDSPIDVELLRDGSKSTVRDIVLGAVNKGTGGDTIPWKVMEQAGTVRQLIERLAAGEWLPYIGYPNPIAGKSPEEIATAVIVRQFVDGWARSSNDSDPRSISKQMAAAEMHGFDHEKFYREEYTHRGERVDQAIIDDARRQLEENRDILEGLTQSEYDATQEMLKEAGIDKVVLYRGFTVQRGDEPSVGDVIATGSNPLSSWTTDSSVAKDFAHWRYRTGVIVAMEVPVEMIQSTTVTGRGCLSEDEVIVIGYPSDSLVIDII